MIEAAAYVSLFSHFLVVSLLNLVVLICKIVIYIYVVVLRISLYI